MKTTITIISLFAAISFQAQLLITEFPTPTGINLVPDNSAVLEVRSNSKGILIPQVALQNVTDQTTVTTPAEGSIALNTTFFPTNQNIPTVKPALTIWDGSKWLFTYNKQNVILDLDKVRTFIADNVTTVSFNTTTTGDFPTTNPTFAYGSGTTGWKILIDSDNSLVKPTFEFNAADAEQRMVIDVEGIAASNTSTSNAQFNYAIGVFVNNQLISAQKFYNTTPFPTTCYFQKYNIRALVLDNAGTILTSNAGVPYNVKVGVRALVRPTTQYNNLTFGNGAPGCTNLNSGTAKSYMTIQTIERKHVN